jgi:hypothetical protein
MLDFREIKQGGHADEGYLEAILYNPYHQLCGLVVIVEDYKHRGPGFDSRALLRIFLRELGLERGPLSLVIR